MVSNKLLTIREVASYLNITEKEVVELAENGAIPAYKVGGVYLRFKKEQLDQVKPRIKPNQSLVTIEGTLAEKVKDFIYHNDFYILSLVVIFFLLYFIVKL
ncbi:MAG: helix-turn-helix domain-containing protein [Candidatus Omnitrophica bacterium]|nr:helix-turn-helix domain-containing protein [Candidatus Omnitrophota bacterium]MDD5573959.1 helix-turn-helix domain-containing protein [Candidatus Omnitrophota bacterium]